MLQKIDLINFAHYKQTGAHPQEVFTRVKYSYPVPGYSEVRLIWKYGTQMLGCWGNAGSRWVDMFQSPKVEFIFMQDYWLGGESIFADILVPACTNLERNDMTSVAFPDKMVIEPMWESKSDLWIEYELAKRLGVYDKMSEGNSEMDWIKKWFNYTRVSDYKTFDEWWNMYADYGAEGVLPTYWEEPWDPLNKGPPPAKTGFWDYAENPQGLDTKSGKIEFYAQWIEDWWPGDTERPPVPQCGPGWESLSTPLAKKYPLVVMSGHPRFRHHTQFEENPWLREIPGTKR